METQGVEFREALEILAKQAGVELTKGKGQDKSRRNAMADAMSVAQAFFREQYATNSRAQEYCAGRGLAPDVVDKWEIGFAPNVGEALVAELKKQGHRLALCAELNIVDGNEQIGYQDRFRGRLMFPIRDDQGNLVAFGGRVIGDGMPKYINSSDTPLFSKGRTLYGMHQAKDSVRRSRQAVLVEGYLDVIACHQAGVTNAVATLGTAMSEHHVKRLALWCDEVVMLYDSDPAGQKAAERSVEMLTEGGLKSRVALMPKGQDPDTLLRESGPEAVKSAVSKGVEPIEYLLKQIGQRHATDKDEFWQEATAALAKLSNPLDVERYLMPLAGSYPFMRDPERAATALRGMVRQARRSASKPTPEAPKRKEAPHGLPIALPPNLESAPFRALLSPEIRSTAWEICRQEDLFVTETGRRLSRALIAAWIELPRDQDAAGLIESVQDEKDRDLLAAVFMHDGPPIDELAILAIRERLERRRDEIALRSVVGSGEKTDEDLLRIDARLKELKGAKPLENPLENRVDNQPDPFV